MGSVGAKESTAQSSTRISGEVDLQTLRNATKNRVEFWKNGVQVDAWQGNGKHVITKIERKNDIGGGYLDGINEFVGELYLDRAGNNMMKRLSDIGFEVQAQAVAYTAQGKIPEKRAYLFVKKNK